jgi:hypothetical protein
MQKALHNNEVGLTGVMHVDADLLDDVGNVGAGERQVLESTSEATKLSHISSTRLRLGEDLGLRVHGCQNWLVVHYVGTLKDVNSVLAQ